MLGDQPPPAEQVEGWYPDPLGGRSERYWDGQRWTPHVRRHGQAGGGGSRPAARATAKAKARGDAADKGGWSARRKVIVFAGIPLLLLGALLAIGALINRDVPNVVGLSVADARSSLEDEGLEPKVEGPETGVVCEQDPAGGEGEGYDGQTVTLTTAATCDEPESEIETVVETETVERTVTAPEVPPNLLAASELTLFRSAFDEWKRAEEAYGADFLRCAGMAEYGESGASACFRRAGGDFRAQSRKLHALNERLRGELTPGPCRTDLARSDDLIADLAASTQAARAAGIQLDVAAFRRASNRVSVDAPVAIGSGSAVLINCDE